MFYHRVHRELRGKKERFDLLPSFITDESQTGNAG
jgi:hypothetical protein